jgi:diacylglycerol kinase family enzyme
MRVRALLIVNPHATSTTSLRRDVIVSALASEIELRVVHTRYRGHAAALAAGAAADGLDLVLTLGGDGTVNEAVNGLLGSPNPPSRLPARPQPVPLPAGRRGPAFAPIPGGNANVFTRALGLPADPIDATGRILGAIISEQTRSIGVGRAGDRYFTFNAGLGLDAEVVRAVEGRRASGRQASTWFYFWMTVRQYYAVTDRRHPAMILERPGHPPAGDLFFSIVSNTAPWTYVGSRPLNPNPLARFDTGLDVLAFRQLRTVSTLNAARQMLRRDGIPASGRHVLALHDEREFTVRSARPIAFQVDGEYMGEREHVVFRSVPEALRVMA